MKKLSWELRTMIHLSPEKTWDGLPAFMVAGAGFEDGT
jgi:hypothetical protein